MTIYKCTGCGATLFIRVFILEATIQCPVCGRIEGVTFAEHRKPEPAPPPEASGRIARQFPTAAAASEPAHEEVAPAADTTSAIPLLTVPHRCHQCSAPIKTPIDKAADTLTCPTCQHQTSAFAALHRCNACARTLESPTSSCGSELPCPNCNAVVIVPWRVLHRRPTDEETEQWFWCTCSNCQSLAAVRKDEVGVWGVCPSCLWPMQAPRWGERIYLEETPGVARNVRCPACQLQVPLTAHSCPLCSANLAG